LAFLGPGDFFGEMALLENLPRSASAQVVEPSRLIEVDSATFEEMIRGSSEVAVRLMRKIASRLRESDHRIQNLLMESALGRAIEVLRWLSQQGVAETGFVRLAGAAGQINLATQAGVPPAQAAEIFSQLARAGCLKVEGPDLLIASPEVLDEYAQYLEMKRKYDSPGAQLPSEVAGVRHEDRMRAMQTLLTALKLTPEDIEHRQEALAQQYRRYGELKRRFHAHDGKQE
jgi:CRP/FNR family transcriptional regulator, cyclic AMP receptor protein